MVSFKELCGLSSVANLMQCMLAVSPRFLGPDNSPLVVLNLSEQYPTMELQGIVPEVLKKIVTTYDMVSDSLCSGRLVRKELGEGPKCIGNTAVVSLPFSQIPV